jgi:2-oxoglutarate ferredoxin oxidoreductase subunit gamma
LVVLAENHRQDISTHGLPATKIAEELGNNRAANTVMLGFWTAATGLVSKDAMRQSVADSVPPKTIDVNMKTFDVGYEAGLQIANNE